MSYNLHTKISNSLLAILGISPDPQNHRVNKSTHFYIPWPHLSLPVFSTSMNGVILLPGTQIRTLSVFLDALFSLTSEYNHQFCQFSLLYISQISPHISILTATALHPDPTNFCLDHFKASQSYSPCTL